MTQPLVQFGDLPPKKGNGRKPSATLVKIAEKLTEAPGQWGLIRTCSSTKAAGSLAYQIRQGTSAAFRPAGHYEASARGKDVHARYVGPDGEHA